MISSLSAVFALRQDITATLSFGKSRIIGNTIGAGAGIIYFFLLNQFNRATIIELITVPILVALIIIFSDGINNNTGIIGAISAFLIISLTVPKDQTYSYAIYRVLDTFIGTFVAIAVNALIKPPTEEVEAEIAEDLEELDAEKTALEEKQQELQQPEKPTNRSKATTKKKKADHSEDSD